LKQVLLNLLSNAVKYNRPRGSVAVSCREQSATELRISVADTGPGIRPELMSRLYAPFDRLDAGQTDVEGTGIGLALSKSLAEAMGGRYLYADQQRAKQVLLNLLSNAVKYNRPRGTVAISCFAPDETHLRISVADTGTGIRSDQMGKLFSPFERLDAAQTDVEGTGIGLTLSRYLTQAMGGTLDVESILEQGGTFSVTLPAAESPVNRFERLYDGNGSPVAANQGPQRKVLCIEDNASNLTLVKRILDRRPDIEVVAANQGALGVELAAKLHPALVLLDLHLPDIPGEQILHRLRSDKETSSIPVAILSADATVGQSQRLLAAGAVAYMSKPLDVAELLRLVDEMVTQS